MKRPAPRTQHAFAIAVLLLAAGCSGAGGVSSAPRSTRYEDLTALFGDWRTFQKPHLIDGVPDYSPSAMSAQQTALGEYQSRLRAIDPTAWTVPQQVDYLIVRAEMSGLEFDHRVLKPWANNPAFYVTFFTDESDQPAREGPYALGAVETFRYPQPLSAAAAAAIDSGVRAIPALLTQAQKNLVGNQKDIWNYGIETVKGQSRELATYMSQLAGAPKELTDDLAKAKSATDAYITWLQSQADKKSGASGVGVENYNWYLKNVQLLPYTWKDLVMLMERELDRSWSFLGLEEARNAGVPALALVSSPQEHSRRFNAAVTQYMAYLRDHDLLTVKDYMEPRLRERIGTFSDAPREFFTEVDYRDPMVMRTHGFHWFDKGQMAMEPHSSVIRRGPLLYNIFNTRTEGLATEWEEMMMGAGMFDKSPRSRELILILVAERAARALGDLRMHSNEFTLEQASAFASANTPRNWLSLKGNLVRWEQHLYLQQPAYGVSYVIGKVETERAMQAEQRRLGDKFTFRPFMDRLLSAGQIPISLVGYEMTGELSPDLKALLRPGGS